MRQIITMNLLLFAATLTAQWHGGEIAVKTQGDSLEIYFETPPQCFVPYDSIEVFWKMACNPFHQNQYYEVATLDPGDTLRLPATGWRAVWASCRFHGPDFESLYRPTNTLIVESDLIEADLEVYPNPSDGNFDLRIQTTATKQYVRIIGPWGMVWAGWSTGNHMQHFSLLPFNPNGLYTVITDWHFDTTCEPVLRTRSTFIVMR